MEGGVRLNGHQANCRVALAQVTCGTHRRSRCAQPGHKMRDLPVRVVPNFRPGRFRVGLPVGGVVVLIRIEVAGRVSGMGRPRLEDRAIRSFERRGQHEVRTERTQDGNSFRAGVGWNHQTQGQAERCSKCRVGDSHVAGGRVEQNSGAVQAPLGESCAQDGPGRPVFDRTARVVPLSFGPQAHLGGQLGVGPAQWKERCVTDREGSGDGCGWHCETRDSWTNKKRQPTRWAR